MPSIRIYEPALCCNTGVCGPDVDQSLVDVTAAIRTLQSNGIDIERYNLANDPSAFVNDETARAFLQTAGSDGLPLTVVDGVTVAAGTYPSARQLLSLAGMAPATGTQGNRPDLATQQTGSECGPASGCC